MTTTIGDGTLTVTPNAKPYGEEQNYSAFAVIKSNGSVIAWGDKNSGGDISSIAREELDGTIPVMQIFSNSSAFAALRTDGSVVTWGNADLGGDSSTVASSLNGDVDVTKIYSNGNAFAALRADGSVVSWGQSGYSKTGQPLEIDTSLVASQINGSIPVTQIYSGFSDYSGFSALRADGSVVTWGQNNDSSVVANSLNGDVDVTTLYSTGYAFAALRADGSVVTWGSADWGGDSSTVAEALNGDVDVTTLYSTGYAFAALRADGSVVTWGNAGDGGDSSTVAEALNGDVDVTTLYSNGYAFAALRADGSVVTWGSAGWGGDSGAFQLTDVVSFANPATDDIYIPAEELHVNQAPTGNITIAGTAKQGQTLTVKNTLADEDGLGDFSFQWLGNGAEIIGATKASYVLSAVDLAKKISVQVSYLDGEGTDELVTSKATTAVTSNVNTNATSGNDQITGPTKSEKIDGLAGNDLLKGLAGNDTLIGGAGLDTLIGGAGADNLTGGTDSDVFKLTLLTESGITSKTRDTITDFLSGTDKIDLSALDANETLTGDQAFTFIGSAAFNKTNAAGQLRFDTASKILYGSTDADIAPEFSIQLNGVTSLLVSDFIL